MGSAPRAQRARAEAAERGDRGGRGERGARRAWSWISGTPNWQPLGNLSRARGASHVDTQDWLVCLSAGQAQKI